MKKTIKKVLFFFLVLLLGIILGLSSFMSREIFKETNLDSNRNSHVQIANGVMDQSLVFGQFAGPTDMDPHMCYDTAGGKVISQICEGLYKFDVTDPSYPLLPVLATALPSVTPDGLEITIDLRTGVKFHDGTDFDAAAAKWNFDRLNYFMNYSGNQYLPAPFNVPLAIDVQVAKHFVLFNLGGKPIMNRTEVVDIDTIKIYMNIPKASFINLLNYEATSMQSPTATKAQGKELEILTYADGDVLIGTGPFKFQSYFTDIQVKFTRFDDYWDGPAQLTNITFEIIDDPNTLNMAVLAGDIDLYDAPSPAFFDQFEADPDITLLEAGPTLNTNYMGFNGYMVNTTFREAISRDVNYSYIIDVVLLGEAYRLKSPIPTGIPMSNYGFNYPTFDRAAAQALMVSMGYGGAFTTDQDWYDLALAGGWGFGWNITAQTEGTTRRDIALYVSDNLKYIGINAPVEQISFWDLISCMTHDTGSLRRDKIPMYMLGWAPDYIDPENYITPLYSNTSFIWVNTYDYELELWMLAGEITVDPVARKVIYDNIQQKLVEELFFFVWFTSGKNYDVYQNYVHGWVPNAIARVDFYPVYLGTPDLIAPTITINSPTPNQLCGITAPNFNIQIIEPNLQQKLYSLNGRPNITFTTETQFSQTEWNNIGNGTASITFYAIDGAGNVNSSEVIVRKDAIIPDITINSPIADDVFTEPPEFTISIIEEDLVSRWYTVEGRITQYPFTGLTGTIDEDGWDDAPEGDVTITFYAEDGAGNIGSESVTVIKSQPSVPEIPGYYFFILSSIFFIALISITRKRKIIRK